MTIFEYKGYKTIIGYDETDEVFFGKIEGISDLVNFESKSQEKIEKEFQEAVDDYLAFCKDNEFEPKLSSKKGHSVDQ